MISCGNTSIRSEEITSERIEELEEAPNEVTLGLEQENEKDDNLCEDEIHDIFNKAVCFSLSEKIETDFDGDGFQDEAVFSLNEENPFITIREGKSNKQIRIGPNSPLKGIGGDFRWVDYWGVLYDSVSFEILIEDGEVIGDTFVDLTNPSIFLRQSEFGGGLITFYDGRYRWIHQAD
jgi:hypothetical protein